MRDIADSAGILGSLYHHFKSKEQMVEEVLRDFLDWLFARYQEIVETRPNPLERLKGPVWRRSGDRGTATPRW